MVRGMEAVGLLGLCLLGCGGDDGPAADSSGTTSTSGGGPTGQPEGTTAPSVPSTGGTTTTETSTGGMSSSSDTGFVEPEGPWQPGTVFPSTDEPTARGLYDVRGLVHTHSPYSHDACDGEPLDEDGNIDLECFADLRRGICRTRHDFVMLTDHRESFSDFEYPDTLLHDPKRGDVLVEHGGMPTANWTGCPAVSPVLVMAGCESAMMPVGLESHVPGRSDVYGDATVDAKAIYDDHGALTLVAHTEDWSVSEILDLGLDGFEMYNLHANLFANVAAGAVLIGQVQDGGEGLPHSDLVMYPIYQEDDRYLSTWGTVLSMGARPVTTMGTDAHRNTFPQELPDGERIDSFRRMMQWFSNHVLVDAEDWDDRDIKDAMRAGRLYGAFEYLGYPTGFDAFADGNGNTVELGGEIALGDGPEIHAVAPTVRRLDPDATAPEITLHILRAIDGGFEEVAAGEDTLDYMPDATGAYRVEVRIAPRHLEVFLGDYADTVDEPRVWIYANPFYIV